MKVEKLELKDTGLFSSGLINYVEGDDALKPFYNRSPELVSFKGQIEEKLSSYDPEIRPVLKNVLLDQYTDIAANEPDSAVLQNIECLTDEKTFTVTTGHQLNIFTGPLYFHYKIITVINAAKKLKKAYPEYNFVPVYWMASEDHDIDEIRQVNVGGNKYSWDTDQKGPVGRFLPNGLADLAREIPGDTLLFQKAYGNCDTLGDAVRTYVNDIYNDHGLVVIDADEASLKKFLIPVIKDDILNNTAKKLVDKDTEKLESLGYSSQIFPREINFFYIKNGLRERIVKVDEGYHVNNTEIFFSEDEIMKEMDTHPEKFSPNVILRPLYQEIILPNLSYSGGPAEQVYWLQLKSVFENYKVPFPILVPRNFVMIVNHTVLRKMDKVDVSVEQTFMDTHELITRTVEKFSKHDLSLNPEKDQIDKIFDELKDRAVVVDGTLERTVLGEARKAEKMIEKLQKKLIRAEKRTLEDKTNQVEYIRSKLFPNETPQERVMNFLDFESRDTPFVHSIIDHIDPFDIRYNVILMNESNQ